MDIEYELDENDLIALVRFQVSRSSTAHRRYWARRILYLIGFGLLALGTYSAFSSIGLSITFGVLAVLSFVLYPLYYRWALEKNIPRVVRQRATSGSFAKRVLRAIPEGLEQISEDSESKVKWKLVDDIVVTPTHAFLSLDGTFSVVIPKARLGDAVFEAFLNTVQQYRESADNW